MRAVFGVILAALLLTNVFLTVRRQQGDRRRNWAIGLGLIVVACAVLVIINAAQ